MSIQTANAKDEYAQALRQGHKEYKELTAQGKSPFPEVLDEILPDVSTDFVQDVGLVEIPSERIIGTKSAGRISAFTAGFLPLLGAESEFAIKWVHLCAAHLSDVGIRDPITCYEYLGNFYVEEGNKRVSVLRYFGAPRIPGMVKRILPPQSEDPRIKAYYEFLEFYKLSKVYFVQFRRPGDYAKLLAALGKAPGESWTEDDRRNFGAYLHYFQDAFNSCNGKLQDILPEEALLMWLEVHEYKELGTMTAAELRKSLAVLWPDVLASTQQSEVKVETAPVTESKGSLLTRIISSTPDHLNVAFVHQLDPKSSGWVQGHEDGRKYLEEVFGDKITCRSYFGANHAMEAEQALEQAVADGADVVFSTAPKLIRATLKIAVQYPKVHFLNCSVDQPYSSVQTYYGRIFEAKFITGAIAGAIAQNDRIGYIGSNPIFGVPASINAFALGALMTNPRVQIELRWSCVEGTPQADFFADGIRVISNRDTPDQDRIYTDYGTYFYNDEGKSVALGSPVWKWGNLYEHVIKSILNGTWDSGRSKQAVNYWWGINSGVIDVALTDKLPEGVRYLAEMLRTGLIKGTIDPFRRSITDQNGILRNNGTQSFTPEELMRMDWLCGNVVGHIPRLEEVIPASKATVKLLGVFEEDVL